jgi:hypothetical protein
MTSESEADLRSEMAEPLRYHVAVDGFGIASDPHV